MCSVQEWVYLIECNVWRREPSILRSIGTCSNCCIALCHFGGLKSWLSCSALKVYAALQQGTIRAIVRRQCNPSHLVPVAQQHTANSTFPFECIPLVAIGEDLTRVRIAKQRGGLSYVGSLSGVLSRNFMTVGRNGLYEDHYGVSISKCKSK